MQRSWQPWATVSIGVFMVVVVGPIARRARRAAIARLNATASLSFYSQPAHGTRNSTDRSTGGGLVPSREIAGGVFAKGPPVEAKRCKICSVAAGGAPY